MDIAANVTQLIPCSLESLQHNEPLIGTAPRANVWFLLEYPGRWGNKALKESEIPDQVKSHLNAHLDRIPESRLLLVKGAAQEPGKILFFAALPALNQPMLYRFELRSYSELLDLELTSIADQDSQHVHAISNQNLFVMCTNGLRDQCCALHGVATFNAIHRQFSNVLWQSTHHGGHRFAANLLHFPFGHSYGRLRPENARGIITAALGGRIRLDHFRGRTIYPEPVQAGEIMLRQALGLDTAEGLELTESAQENENWKLRFSGNGEIHHITVSEQPGEHVPLSCGDEKTSPIMHYRLVEHQAL